NEESIVFITYLGSFFPILLNTLHGMAMVDPVFIRAAQCLGAREASIFREVYFPATLPHVFTGLTVGMGVAWVSLIAAEMISGPSGCGKSTLLNAVAGFLKPTRGDVAVDGDPVARPSADRGMVFQQYSLFPWKTVRENVEFGLKMKGMERSKRETSARTLLGL